MDGSREELGELDQKIAKMIIARVGGHGIPPEYGFNYFTVGLERYLNTLEKEYLETLIKDGGSSFKMIVAPFGNGKTHFLYCVRDLAWKHNYLISYITLSPQQTPFYKLEEVYKAIVENLTYPQEAEELLSGSERGIEAVIKKWFKEKYQEFSTKIADEEEVVRELVSYASSLSKYDSASFRNAVKEAFIALAKRREPTLIFQWLSGENPPRNLMREFRVFEKIDRSTAFKMIRSLAQWVKEIGYSGLVVLMDEAEMIPSMSSKQKARLLQNLRELIDHCGQVHFGYTMWFYAVPDESFLEGRTQVFEALRQRLSTVFDEINPTGVKILLDSIVEDPIEYLKEIGKRLARIYEVAYDVRFDDVDTLEEAIESVAREAYEKKFQAGYKRLFVQAMIRKFHELSGG